MGFRIREVRRKCLMSQVELAEKSGVSRATISGLESGSVKVTTSTTLLKIAKALSTTVDQLFFDESV